MTHEQMVGRWCAAGPTGVGWRASGEPPRFDPALLAGPVLVIEDEAMIAWTMESLLEEMGFSAIAIAASGEQAVEVAGQVRPRLILSDINLGPAGMDGVQAVVAILARRQAAVVFVSAYIDADAQQRIVRHVPAAVTAAKPVGSDELRRAIHRAATPPIVQ